MATYTDIGNGRTICVRFDGKKLLGGISYFDRNKNELCRKAVEVFNDDIEVAMRMLDEHESTQPA